MMRPLYLSYHTGGAYATHAAKLEASAAPFEIDLEVHELGDEGGWQANTQRKASFLAQQRERHDLKGRPIVWVDADARFRAQPELLDTLHLTLCDIAAHMFEAKQLASGTIWIADTAAARHVLGRWVERCEARPRELDQDALKWAVEAEMKGCGGLTFRDLPPSYCYIFDLSRERYPHFMPVIEHMQASRQERFKAPKGAL